MKIIAKISKWLCQLCHELSLQGHYVLYLLLTDQSHLISKPVATMEKVHSIFKCFLSTIPQYPTARFRRPEENLEKMRILETKMYQELLISGLIIPFYFVCEMCEVFRLNEVQSSMIRYKEEI